MARIGMITTNSKMGHLAKELADEMGHELFIELGALELAEDIAKKLLNDFKVDAIIARGATGHAIKKHLPIPVIIMDITNYEIVKALKSARQLGNKIAMFDAFGNSKNYDFDSVKSTLDIEVHHITFNNMNKAKNDIIEAQKNGIEVIISSGGCLLAQAKDLGIKCVLIETSRLELQKAFERAKDAIEARNRELEKSICIQTIINNSQEGIITITNSGQIEYINREMEKISGLIAGDFVGKNIKHLSSRNEFFKNLYGNAENVSNVVIDYNNEKYVLNRLSILLDNEQKGLVIYLKKASDIQEMEIKIRKRIYFNGFVARASFSDIITECKVMKDIIQKAQNYAETTSNVLIYGESGTGKELFAQSIHNTSPYRKGPFLAVNCASLPDALLESELFGYEEGAFTGARKGGKPGLFELAHDGTILLDEIGEMSLSLQPRLLRVIQERQVMRLGGDRVIPVNNRIICATNRDLASQVKDDLFREDLYYRINILEIKVPPLRERNEDIPLIAAELNKKINKKLNKKVEIPQELFQDLKKYAWPGNVRQLEAFIERLLASSQNTIADKEVFYTLFNELRGKPNNVVNLFSNNTDNTTLPSRVSVNIGTMDEMERDIIEQVYRYVKGDKKKLIDTLGLSRTTLWRKLKID